MRIGLDIGGSKIAGALFSQEGQELAKSVLPTPSNYSALVMACKEIVKKLETGQSRASIGAGVPGIINPQEGTVTAANIPYMKDQPLQRDLEKAFNRPVAIANDAVCATLAEALEGAGRDYRSVFGLILGTGVGGAQVIDGRPIENTQGLTGEIGHKLLPFREPTDGLPVSCMCGHVGCIDKSVSGPALTRLYEYMTDKKISGPVTDFIQAHDPDAERVLTQYYTTLAKAMSVVLDDYEPDIIIVSGGLVGLPGLYEEVPKRWGRYAERPTAAPKFVAAQFGTMSGLRGAARLGPS